MNGPGFLAVTIQPGPNTDEAAFHQWYNEEHGPLRLRLPFIENGYRYKAADDEDPPWIAVYDVSDLAWLEKRIYTRLREERSAREKAVMSTFQALDRRIYSLVSTRGDSSSGPAPVLVFVHLIVRESDLGDLDKWLEEEHLDMASKVPGWIRSRRFRTQIGGSKSMPSHGHVETLVILEFKESNGLGGAEHKAAEATAWTKSITEKVVAFEKRQWAHYLTFDALQEPTNTFITTDGAELNYNLQGSSSDPVVVFVNSILTNYSIWDDVADKLVREGINGQTYRVLRYNARGYHQQAARSNPTRFDILADDLEYLLQRLDIEKVHAVVGVSMGGVTSINFAIRHPEMLDKFVACDCNVAASSANNQAWADRVELAKTKGIGELADVTMKRWFTPENHNSPNAKKVVDMIKQANVDGFAQNAEALCNYDLKEHLSSIKTPGLLIAGEGDGKLPEAMQKFGISNTTFKAIPQAGHLPMLENLDDFMAALRDFL